MSDSTCTTATTGRKAISKSKRFHVFHRDGFICQYCGRRPPDVVLELDHIHPHSKGGDNSDMNLITSCDECNRGKSDKVLTERAVRPDADLAFLEAQQEIAEAKRFLAAKAERDRLSGQLIAALTDMWETLFPSNKCPYDFVFKQMLESHPPAEIADAMRIASRRHARQSLGYQDNIVSYIWGVMSQRAKDQRP